MMMVGLLVGLIAGIVIGAAVYGREMRRMARFLRERPAGSNARLTVRLPGGASRELARAINAQLDAIQSERIAAMTKTQEFQRDLSSLAHDVRTPLMGAQGHIQLAMTEDLPADDERHLTAALQRLDDVRGLLDQLFAYARANDPDRTLDLEPVAVQPLVAEVLVGHYPEFEERGWEPAVDFADERFMLEADRTALRRIVDNLVTNALRHGDGAPTIRQRGDAIVFANPVSDEAAAAIDPNRLFDRFYQADDTRGTRGSGLGLAVAQSLARAMRLRLTATLEHSPGAGAVLALSLAADQTNAV
ncbi:two-component system sensor histidine kinase [Bifidobacterium ramosum]|uniref:Sensor-like histidine kinase SenX3 n=1 Tax=Bifidobacterium ramosum TaxID=1798158 RepID=A0A6L4WZK7_9BIFI|nr:HAMP domain-containing sensor histidine kinase [Bifidobacterium ramosum]KAB8287844.1 two-component system sensor histidine kinase [Bifidobacterium ramosum]NEG71209.1 sensor histidine kinase [Bifidobacterium ramosum]